MVKMLFAKAQREHFSGTAMSGAFGHASSTCIFWNRLKRFFDRIPVWKKKPRASSSLVLSSSLFPHVVVSHAVELAGICCKKTSAFVRFQQGREVFGMPEPGCRVGDGS